MAEEKPLLSAYLLVGDDELKQEMSLVRMRKRVAAKGDIDFNSQTLQGERLKDASELLDACLTLPFASDVRLVVLKDADKIGKPVLDALINYLKEPSPTTVLLMTAQKLAANARLRTAMQKIGSNAIIDCTLKKKSEMPAQVRTMALTYGVTIAPEAAAFLVEQKGTSTIALNTELNKLALYVTADKRDTITRRDVAAVVTRTATVDKWDLVNALGERDLPKVLAIRRDLADQSPQSLLPMCLYRIRDLIAVKTHQRRGVGNVAAAMKKQDWQVRGLVAAAGKFNSEELVNLIEAAAETDKQMKSGANAERALEDWLIKACTPA
jgi:DNA polymerase-3 subunit delta